jgi:hypothetical protein
MPTSFVFPLGGILRTRAPGKITAGLHAALEAAGAVPPPIEVEPVAEIEREPGAAKMKLVKSAVGSPTV